MKQTFVSVVIPIFNEEENIPALWERLAAVLKAAFPDPRRDWEVIFTDDGSRDHSLELLKVIAEGEPRVSVVEFNRNYGQHAAIFGAFGIVSGEVIVTLDADLQNPPEEIPKLVAKIDEGYDVVSGWRRARQDTVVSRRLPSMIANQMISNVTGVHLHDYGCSLKVYHRDVVKGIRLYGEMHRFIPAIASGMGISFTEVKVNHRARRFGTSKYGISRTIRVVLDLITVKFMLSYATRPLHVFGTVGVVSSLLGVTIGLILTVQRQLFGIGLANRPLLLLAVLLIFMGIQFITIGLLAELVVRTYHESQKKPIYYVRKVLGEPVERAG